MLYSSFLTGENDCAIYRNTTAKMIYSAITHDPCWPLLINAHVLTMLFCGNWSMHSIWHSQSCPGQISWKLGRSGIPFYPRAWIGILVPWSAVLAQVLQSPPENSWSCACWMDSCNTVHNQQFSADFPQARLLHCTVQQPQKLDSPQDCQASLCAGERCAPFSGPVIYSFLHLPCCSPFYSKLDHVLSGVWALHLHWRGDGGMLMHAWCGC